MRNTFSANLQAWGSSLSVYTISLLVAYQEKDRGIGYQGHLPWRLKDDLAHFHTTVAHTRVIMGRKTLESMGKPLPQAQENIVLSSSLPPSALYTVCPNINQLYDTLLAQDPDVPLCVIGGHTLFQIFFPHCTTVIQTLVEAQCPVDAFFPNVSFSCFHLSQEKRFSASEDNAYAYRIQTLRRIIPKKYT